MKIRVDRWCSFKLISLLSFFALAVQTGAHDDTLYPLSGPTNSRGETGKTSKPLAAGAASGYTYSVLYSFCSAANCTDGNLPSAGLTQDAAGNLYGTTTSGGANSNPACGSSGCGTVFMLDDTGHETVLYSFCSASNCADGANPQAGLIRDAAGNLFGTTTAGGLNYMFCSNGCGTVFEVDNTGHETVLYRFCSNTMNGSPCLDGASPQAGLIKDAAGNLYGTTKLGGPGNGGTVFKLDNAGHETVLDGFCAVTTNCTDGSAPESGLIQDAAGNLYGATSMGGNGFYTVGGGTVFKLDSSDHWTLLHSFCSASNCPDGFSPQSGLIQDAVGNLYGTTAGGGAGVAPQCCGGGTVFKLDTTDRLTTLYDFCTAANCTDGGAPTAALIQDAAGNLYSTTTAGGANSNSACGSNGCGTVFKVDNMGHETVAYSFCSAANCADGANPQAGLIQDAAGNLYSTAAVGGANGRGGVVFKLTPPILIITSTPVNISPGDTTTSTITVTPGATFTGSVILTAAITSGPAGAQDPPTLSFGSTSPVSIPDASGATALLTIKTTAATSAALAHPALPPAARWYIAGATGLAFVMLIGVPVHRRGGHTRLGILVFLTIFIEGLIACGGGSGGGGSGGGNPGTTPGAYVVTVTGTSGSITATGAVALTVQ